MPGSSLWLLPPADHPLSAILPDLINSASSHFGTPHRFVPHVTLTSDISPSLYDSDPQKWLDSLRFSSLEPISVRFEEIASEDVFFRKLYIKCMKNEGIKELAKVCRQTVAGYDNGGKAGQWTAQDYNPHLSLIYHDCPKINQGDMKTVEKIAHDIGVIIGDQQSAWEGGRVVLVPTDTPINQWTPIAQRVLGSG